MVVRRSKGSSGIDLLKSTIQIKGLINIEIMTLKLIFHQVL